MYTIGTYEEQHEDLEKLYPLGKPVSLLSNNLKLHYYYYELSPALYALILLVKEVPYYSGYSTKNGIWVDEDGDFMFDREEDHLRAVEELQCTQ